jgi:hypothetical protein
MYLFILTLSDLYVLFKKEYLLNFTNIFSNFKEVVHSRITTLPNCIIFESMEIC